MILHIPHASTDTLNKKFLCDLSLELERMTDVDTDRLFDYREAVKIIFPISRLICDVERFEDDSIEEMASKGMGVCYTTNSFGKPLRNITPNEREEILKKYYRPHHKRLTEAVKKELEIFGKALIIDCHSFSNEPLPHENSQKTPRPDFCIGTDPFHTPEWLTKSIKEFLESEHFTVSINDPFAGTLIPMEYYQKDANVSGIMIEINRDLYTYNFAKIYNIIQRLLDNIEKEFYFKGIDTHVNMRAVEALYKDPSVSISIFEVFDSLDGLWDNANFYTVYHFNNLQGIAESEYMIEYASEYFDQDFDEIPITDEQKYETVVRWLNESFDDDGTKDSYLVFEIEMKLTDDKTVYLVLMTRTYNAQEWSIDDFIFVYGVFNTVEDIHNQLERDDYYFKDPPHEFNEAFWLRLKEDIVENWYFE